MSYREGKFQRSRHPKGNSKLERDWCISRYLQVKGLKDMEIAISDLKVSHEILLFGYSSQVVS